MRRVWVVVAVLVVVGCGGTDPVAVDGGPDASGDASGDAPGDADPCVPGPQACDNCLDDDGDGRRDGDDNECLGGFDNDESSFDFGGTGQKLTPLLECFFDGTSGAGDDGCGLHPCCLIGAPDVASCPAFPGTYDPAACAASQPAACIAFCAPLTEPTCDCFGCCTICDTAGGACRDIVVDVRITPDCDASSYADPQVCLACVKRTDCVGG